MHGVIARIDDLGKAAWIALMVLGFIMFWPVGLAILAYIIWSGRMGMGCGWHGRRGDVEEWRQRAIDRVNRAAEQWERRRTFMQEHRRRWGGFDGATGSRSGMQQTGNRAFDEYRSEALRKLEEEANEFRAFLERLRMARDRAEFDEYMKERRERGPTGTTTEPPRTPES